MSQPFLPSSPMVKQERFLKWKSEEERVQVCCRLCPLPFCSVVAAMHPHLPDQKNPWIRVAQKFGVEQRTRYASFENFCIILRSILNCQDVTLRWTDPSQQPLQPVRHLMLTGNKKFVTMLGKSKGQRSEGYWSKQVRVRNVYRGDANSHTYLCDLMPSELICCLLIFVQIQHLP